MKNYHTPVMAREALEGLGVKEGKQYIDATLGGAGHTVEILRLGGNVLGIDADGDALAFGRERLKSELPETKEGSDWILVKGNFRDLENIAKHNGFTDVSGVLMDLGVSSYQLDTQDKGFSYRFEDSSLDMRFDQTEGVRASEYIHSASGEELYEAFTKYGEEERAWPIVHALTLARKVKKFETVGDVVAVIKGVVGDNKQTSGVLSRIFQAIRIKVNDELEALSDGLTGAQKTLAIGGRLVVISFHSLEDRIVKQYMQGSGLRQITKKPIGASRDEQAVNKRSRSAKLRVAEKT